MLRGWQHDRLAFTPDGVQANLNQWRQQKTPLLELLRRHPNWREQELAVVFDLSEQRQLDRACVDETKFEMLTLAEEAGLTGERLEEFRDALDAATADYATVPDEFRLPVIRNRGHIKCDAGMKASRIINRLCAKFGIDQYESGAGAWTRRDAAYCAGQALQRGFRAAG